MQSAVIGGKRLIRLTGLAAAAAVGLAAALVMPTRSGTARAAGRRAVDVGVSVSPSEVGFFEASVQASFSGFAGTFSASVEYGTSTAYGSTCCNRSGLDTGTSPSMLLTGLQDGTTYHLRVVVTDSTGTYYSDDVAITTLASGLPGIAMYSGGYESDVKCFGGGVQVDTKGLDTTWYAVGAASPDLAGAVTTPTQTVGGYPWRDEWLNGGGMDLSLCVAPSTTGLVYLQLHAENARGATSGPVLTYTATTTSTSTAMTPPPAGGTTTQAVTPPATPPGGSSPTMSTAVLPAGVVGQHYRYTLPISGGSPPYTVQLNGFYEAVAPGLQLGSDGVVDGTPTTAGAFSTNIRVYDQRYPPDGGPPAAIFLLTMQVAQTLPATTTAPITTAAPTTTAVSKAKVVQAGHTPWWKSCARLDKRFPHGVGRVGARDKTSGKRVTTFRRSNALYALAMKHNRRLDLDHDGIACEHR